MTTYADPWPAPRARGPVDATVSLPGSKSLTNRALVLAAIADGPSVVRRALRSRDTSLMAVALTSLGARVDTTDDDWAVTPGVFDSDAVVDCGAIASAMYALTLAARPALTARRTVSAARIGMLTAILAYPVIPTV